MSAVRFLCSAPQWNLSGVNTFMANLFRELAACGCEGEIILTETEGQEPPFPLPAGIPIHELPPTKWGENRRRQEMLRKLLIARSPCVYLPNYDFNHLPVIEVLPQEVRVVLIVHSDEDVYYTAVDKYGHAANAIVAVSQTIETRLREAHPHWNEKIFRIPYGVPVPEADENLKPLSSKIMMQEDAKVHGRAANGAEILHVVYSGRFSQHQKRIFDLAEIILTCRKRQLPVRFSLAGSGLDEVELRARLQPAVEDGTAEFAGLLAPTEMNAHFAQADVVILTSEYEGLPLTLLEAMSRHCIPVVTRISSGITELIRDGENGRIAEIGDVDTFAEILAELADNKQKATGMGASAARSIRNGAYNIAYTAEEYLRLVSHSNASLQSCVRRTGVPDVPVHYSWSYRLGKRVRAIAPFSLSSSR